MTTPLTDNLPAALEPDGAFRRTMVHFLARIMAFSVVFLIAGELFFRFVIPAAELPVGWQDTQHTFRRYDPTGPRDGRFTSGRYAQAQGVWHVNDQGWISGRNYLSAAARGKPAVAYVGSSFVEGFYSDLDTHIDVKMERAVNGAYDVYNFGMSNSVPSEHIPVAAYAAEAFQPQVIFFFSSYWHLAAMLKPVAGRQRWKIVDGRVVDRPFRPVRNSTLKALAKRSAIVRYLVINAHWRPRLGPAPVGTLNAAHGGGRKRLPTPILRLLANTLVRRAVTQHPGVRIVFVTGGPYASDAPPTPALQDRLIAAACQTYGADYVDLLPAFHADWLKHHQAFRYGHNFHWNAHAFSVIARRLVAAVAEKPFGAHIHPDGVPSSQ